MDAVGEIVDPEWKRITSKLLRRAIPFDTSTAILFVTEQSIRGSKSLHDEVEERSSTFSFTGEEAKSFYESIVSDEKVGGRVESRSAPEEAEKVAVCGTNARLEHDTFHESRKRKRRAKRKIHADSDKKKQKFSLPEIFRHVQEGNLAQLQAALDNGIPDLNTRDAFGWTLLMCASCAGHMTAVEALMDRGAMWRGVVDKRGYDAPGLARYAGHESIAKFIESYTSSKRRLRSPNLETADVKTLSESFFCDVCRLDVDSASKSTHRSSTVHQFSCQHKPSVSAYMLPKSNRGFQIMVRGGWDPDRGLGSQGQGRQFPIKTVLKQDHLGLGMVSQATKHPRVTHFSARDQSAVRNQRWREVTVGGRRKGKGTKKERLREIEQERGWEIRLRHYMNTD